ncbi:MAG: hypothetical protein WBJ84_00105 [Bacteroidales bacterium]
MENGGEKEIATKEKSGEEKRTRGEFSRRNEEKWRRNSPHQDRYHHVSLHSAAFQTFERKTVIDGRRPLLPPIPDNNLEERISALLASPDDPGMPGHRVPVSVSVYDILPPHH